MTAGSQPRWVIPWVPVPELRAVRHQVNNLLAPVTVAAELLEGESETADLLARSVARIRDVSARMGELLHLGEPSLRIVPVGDLAGLWDLTVPGDVSGCAVAADPERLLCNVVCELRDLGRHAGEDLPAPSLRVGAAVFLLAEIPALVLSAVLPARMRDPDPALAAVPFAVPGADVRLAMVCRETHLHGGRVGVEDDGRTVSVFLPLV